MSAQDAERRLILSYAPSSARAGLSALLALDAALARLVRTTREPMLGRMRLLWWRESLERLDIAQAPAEPVLQALAAQVIAMGVTGASLVRIADGWSELIEAEELDGDAFDRFGAGRGAGLFSAAARVVGEEPVAWLGVAGAGWALADLARHLSGAEDRAAAREAARERLSAVTRRRWPRRTRALGAMALVAARDLDLADGTPPPVGSPRRLARLLWHRWTGR
ncbi:MAG: squalene/phytoene synthase family protein [Pseudomonadota bacterium]